MPKFSSSGHDVVLCQVCARDIDTEFEMPSWRPDITGRQSAANVCPKCVDAHDEKNATWSPEDCN
jgi:hypothetical protein